MRLLSAPSSSDCDAVIVIGDGVGGSRRSAANGIVGRRAANLHAFADVADVAAAVEDRADPVAQDHISGGHRSENLHAGEPVAGDQIAGVGRCATACVLLDESVISTPSLMFASTVMPPTLVPM